MRSPDFGIVAGLAIHVLSYASPPYMSIFTWKLIALSAKINAMDLSTLYNHYVLCCGSLNKERPNIYAKYSLRVVIASTETGICTS